MRSKPQPFLFARTSCSASSVDPGPARARLSAVYALFGVVLIPVGFLAIRLAGNFIHPVVFTARGPQVAGSRRTVPTPAFGVRPRLRCARPAAPAHAADRA